MTQRFINEISYEVIGCAIEVHSHLGPGLLESVYHLCMIDEMERRGVSVKSQAAVPLYYKERLLPQTLKLDLLVEDCIVAELKAVELVHPVHRAQLLSYLKLTSKPKGLLINFHTDNISQSIISLVTKQFASLPKQ